MDNSFLDYSEPKEAFPDKDLAKLGDGLVNLIYSLARSRARGKPDGAKAPNEVLSNALSEADLRHLAPSRTDRHELGDLAEAIIAFAWLRDELEIERAAEIISESLSGRDFGSRKDVFEGAEEGFRDLLEKISERVPLEKG